MASTINITGLPKPWDELSEAERQAYRNDHPGKRCCIIRMDPHLQPHPFVELQLLRRPNMLVRCDKTDRVFAIPTDAEVVASKSDAATGMLLVKLTHPTFAFVPPCELIPTATLLGDSDGSEDGK